MRSGFFLRRRALLAACAVGLLGGGVPLTFQASADPSPIKIAVFDFELDDFSGGAGIAGDKAADLAQLDRATSEVRRLIVQSGRYDLVDVAGAEGDGVKSRDARMHLGVAASRRVPIANFDTFREETICRINGSMVDQWCKCPATAKTTPFPILPKINNRPTIALCPSLLSEPSWTIGASNCLLSVAKYLKSLSKVPSKVWSTCNRKPCGSPKRLSCWRSCWAGKPLTELDHRREIGFAAAATVHPAPLHLAIGDRLRFPTACFPTASSAAGSFGCRQRRL